MFSHSTRGAGIHSVLLSFPADIIECWLQVTYIGVNGYNCASMLGVGQGEANHGRQTEKGISYLTNHSPISTIPYPMQQPLNPFAQSTTNISPLRQTHLRDLGVLQSEIELPHRRGDAQVRASELGGRFRVGYLENRSSSLSFSNLFTSLPYQGIRFDVSFGREATGFNHSVVQKGILLMILERSLSVRADDRPSELLLGEL